MSGGPSQALLKKEQGAHAQALAEVDAQMRAGREEAIAVHAALVTALADAREVHAAELAAAKQEAHQARAMAELANSAVEMAAAREEELATLRAKEARMQAVIDSLL